jgi:hypothetical protein
MSSYSTVLTLPPTYGAVQPPAKRRQTHIANGPQLSPGKSANNSRLPTRQHQKVQIRRTHSHQGGSKKKTKMSKRKKISKY